MARVAAEQTKLGIVLLAATAFLCRRPLSALR
jgi:hypothetical protein